MSSRVVKFFPPYLSVSPKFNMSPPKLGIAVMPIALLKAGVLVNGVLTPAGDTTNASTLTAMCRVGAPASTS